MVAGVLIEKITGRTYDEAIRQFQEAVRINPNHADARNNLALALAKKGLRD